jgi:hypothetical protein
LCEVLSVISGGTKITIYAGFTTIFSGKMTETTKEKWKEDVETYLDCEVIRLNIANDAITIAV